MSFSIRPSRRFRETLSFTVTLPNEQQIVVPEGIVRWSRGQDFAVENVVLERHTGTRLEHFIRRMANNPVNLTFPAILQAGRSH
jgi:hypothetical protein